MSMKSKAMLVVLLMSSIAMVPTSGCLFGSEITFEWEITCSATGYMEVQHNGDTVVKSDDRCSSGLGWSGVVDISVSEGDIVQVVNLQEQAYECEVVISQREIDAGYAFCED